jgi:fructokinase
MLSKRYITVGLGELLWDLFPAGKQLGGAPSNFAYITNLLGDRGIVASRLGNDGLGDEAKNQLQRLGLDTSYVQSDSMHTTGTVKVEVEADGQPQFQITRSVAWDFLQWTPQWQTLARRADAVCFGSLAQRSAESRQTIQAFIRETSQAAVRVFDVNLRQAFYSAQVLSESMRGAVVIKLNHEELPRVMQLLALPHRDERSSAERLLSDYGVQLVCITRGARGSLLAGKDGVHEHAGLAVEVKDTVGAGDAFTAGLIHCYLRGAPLSIMNETANRLGAWVASQRGGTPAADPTLLGELRALVA